MPLTRFTVRQVEAFVVVAEHLGFSAAAERLGLTAQAVSQLVADLEATLGFRLFDRTTRSVALSAAGRDFLASAETLVRQVQAAESAADDVRNRAAGVVRVGAPQVLAATALPEAIRAYRALRPKVVVRIRDVPVDALVDRVAGGDVDLAVGPDRPTGPEVAREPLFDSPWVLWCAPDHPLARRRALVWSDLHGHPLVAAGRDHERSVARMRLNVPDDQRIVPVDVVDHTTTALGIAAQGLAATLAPAYVGVVARSFGLQLRRVRDPETVRAVCLYRPVLRASSPAADGLAEHLAAWLARWPGAAGRARRGSVRARARPERPRRSA
ncbi:MAG: hypothetical protein RJA99_653 [Pseudomonadota bacterium]